MSSDIESDHPSTLKFLDSCAKAVNRSEYIESLLTLRKGVQQLLPYAREIDTYLLLTKLLSVLLTLESHMNWEVRENLKGPAPSSGGAEQVNELSCSFCGKSEREVLKLIAGPNTYICNECVGICNKILKDEAWASPGGGIA